MPAITVQHALLIDDEPASRKAQLLRLEAEGYTVSVAQNEAEAVSRAKQGALDAIFIHLPAAKSGNVKLIQALRAEDNSRHVPIVVIKDHVDARLVPTKLRSVHRDRW